jgi:beta-mannanase
VGTSLPTNESLGRHLRRFEHEVRHGIQIGSFYSGWAYGGFDTRLAKQVRSAGAVPMVTWEPWDYRKGVHQTRFSMASIAAGDHDRYIRQFATAVKRFRSPVLIRFAHEMNGDWYPWAVGVNGTTARQYVTAWRHVVNLFRAVGAGNARWVWSPNVVRRTQSPLAATWPGAGYVDWVGLDGYNGGSALNWGGWLTPEEIFTKTLTDVRAIAPNTPVMITETGCVEAGGDKADWIRALFGWIERHPDVRALVWFNKDAQADWRITTSDAARAAFAHGLSQFDLGPL